MPPEIARPVMPTTSIKRINTHTMKFRQSKACSAYTTHSIRPTFGMPTSLRRQDAARLYIIAPQGSGYATPDDETSPFPDTYEPMMEYPGTMRPGRTPEDQPFHDLPIADDDPDPVPWPHFQQIEWHHRWDPPHAHAIPMEEFIEMQGKWATPEMEAAMRAGARRDVRQRMEQAQAEQTATVVMDDDEDDDFEADIPVELGDGMFGQLGSVAEEAVTAAAVAPSSEDEEVATKETEDEETDDFDDFLLDLGLDADDDSEDSSDNSKRKSAMDALLEATDDDDDDDDDDDSDDVDLGLELGLLDDDDDDDDIETPDLGLALDDENDDIDVTALAAIDDDEVDDGVNFDEDEEDDLVIGDDGVTTVPLDDFGDSDATEGENPFDDGGFDYDDVDTDGNDIW